MKEDELLLPEDSSIPSTLDPVTRNPTTMRSVPYPTSRLSAPFEPVDQSVVLREAQRMLGAVAYGKLQLISEQIKSLQAQAKRIIMEAQVDIGLHNAQCTFQKRPGQVYHLYKRGPLDTDTYFSILSPDEWKTSPHEFLGSYRLNEDLSWSAVPAEDEAALAEDGQVNLSQNP